MSTYTQILYQIVFSTKNRQPTLIEANQNKLYSYIWGLLKNKKCHLYRINGVEGHLHILTHIHPTIALSQLVKDIKLSYSNFIKHEKLFPNFMGWQNRYGAFTYAFSEKNRLIDYVKNQKDHHKKKSFKEEYVNLLQENEIDFEEKFLF